MPPPVLILVVCVTYFVILVGKPLGFVDLTLAPAASSAGLWWAPQLQGSHLCGAMAVLGYSTRNWRCLVARNGWINSVPCTPACLCASVVPPLRHAVVDRAKAGTWDVGQGLRLA